MFFFFFNDTATTEIYTLSLHDALPISGYTPMRSLPTSPDSARRLLSGRRIGFELLTVGSGEAALEQMIQARLAAVGFDVTIRQLELSAFLDRVNARRHEIGRASCRERV